MLNNIRLHVVKAAIFARLVNRKNYMHLDSDFRNATDLACAA